MRVKSNIIHQPIKRNKAEVLAFIPNGQQQEVTLELSVLKRALLTLRAVNHPLRKEMLQMIEQKKKVTVTELYTKLRIEQSLASQQLGLLRKAGAIVATRDGKFIYYSINHKRVHEIAKFVDKLAR